MSLLYPVHLLLGYVEIRAENGFAERFINLCTATGIPLWDMRKSGEILRAKTTPVGYRKIREPARKSSMRVRLVKKHGLPFAADRFFRRTGLVIGFSLMLVILAVLSGRIWVIDVDNQTDIPTDRILSAYEDAGLKIGISRRTDMTKICADASIAMDEAAWTNVNVYGSTATVKISRLTDVPEINKAEGTSNIVALKDGQVEIIEPYRGSAAVKPGQTVMKGELLISGVTESRIQSSIFSDADGYAAASTFIDVETETPQTDSVLVPKTKKIYSIYFLGREIPLGIKKEAEICYLHKSRLYINGTEMPFGIDYRVYTDLEKSKRTQSENEQLLNALNDYSLKAYNMTLHAQVISKNVEVHRNGQTVNLTGRYFCYENIGLKIPFETYETDEPEADEKN